MPNTPIEQIVLVDTTGKQTGIAEKLPSHHANTPLHLAFSVYVFNDQGQFLVTKRALHKKVWPGVWTNSCCGHPYPGEEMLQAIGRRLKYEIGMEAKNFQVLLSDYQYETPPFKGIIEREFCPVYIARATSQPHPNPEETADYQWLSWQDYLQQALADSTNTWSWWCKDQLKLLQKHPLIEQYSRAVAA